MSIHQAVAETRLARAQAVRPQQQKLQEFIPGTAEVDLRKTPEKKGISGWRGPAALLEIDASGGTAVVRYQGTPYTVPLRHIRKHQTADLCVHTDDRQVLHHWPAAGQEQRSALCPSRAAERHHAFVEPYASCRNKSGSPTSTNSDGLYIGECAHVEPHELPGQWSNMGTMVF